MALALAAEGVEAVVGLAESFVPDSVANAVSGGVNFVGEALSLASAVLSLVATVKRGKEAAADIKDQRYAVGILTPTEDRRDLLRKGLIPPYYSTTNIRRLIRSDLLPAGWTTTTLVGQDFGPEVDLQLRRQRARTEARLDAESFARQTQRLKVQRGIDLVQSTKESAQRIKGLRGSVVV